MGKKKTYNKRIDSNKSELEVFSTPVSKNKINSTYVRSVTRPAVLKSTSSYKNAVINKNNKKLIELGLAESHWKTYRVNALYNFKYQRPMLRRYETRLKSIVQSDLSKLGLDSQYYNLKFEVEMQYCISMVFTKNDFPPVKIIIDSDDINENNVYFTGVLLSVDRRTGFMENERRFAGAAILPLFLVAYTDRIFFESVKYFLENQFSCVVSPLKFSSYDLIWMLALFSPKYAGKQNEVSHIEYACPFPELKSIKLAFDPYTIVEVWKGIVDPNVANESQTVSEEQVFEFMNILEKHFFNLSNINLSEFDLKLIRTPLAIVTDHSILPTNTKKIYFVVRHLTHLAQETIR